jgi:hypothetical protein
MLLRCCKDELWGSRLPDAATQRVPHNSPSRSALKRSLHNDVSGKDTRGCSDAAFMHALLKQQSA